jgi:hypothetical protein
MLLNANADVAATNAAGETPLHAALLDDGTIQTLLLWGANIDAQDVGGKTPGWQLTDLGPVSERAAGFQAAVAVVPRLFWSRALHPRLPPQSRKVVFTVLLCLLRCATAAAATQADADEGGAAGKGALALPALPVELKEAILCFVRAVHLGLRRV